MLDPKPTEMTESNYEKFGFGAMVKQKPLNQIYFVLESLNIALLENAGHPSYNPNSLDIYAFTWAHVQYGGTTQICACSNSTGKVHNGDILLIGTPEGTFQGYMVELTKLASV